MPCTAYGHQCVFVASSEAVDIQRSQRIFSSITQVVLMSESGGISENLDAGLRKEDRQEDGMPVSTQPNSRVSADGDRYDFGERIVCIKANWIWKLSSEKETR